MDEQRKCKGLILSSFSFSLKDLKNLWRKTFLTFDNISAHPDAKQLKDEDITSICLLQICGPRGFLSAQKKRLQTSIISHGERRDIIKKQKKTIHLLDMIGWIVEYWNKL